VADESGVTVRVFLSHDVDWSRRGPGVDHVLARRDRFDEEILRRALEEGFNPYFGIPDVMEVEERLREEAKKLDLYAPKGRPESFEYLRPVGVHRAARWYRLLEKLKERGYLFDLRFSAEIEELMNLMLFAYAFDSLVARGVLTLDSAVVKGRLYDKDGFESLFYEVLVASLSSTTILDLASEIVRDHPDLVLQTFQRKRP
jgi:hypothetical protein